MSHFYPSDISREQFNLILPTLASGRRRTKPRTVDFVRCFLRGAVGLEKRVSVAYVAPGFPRLAHLLQIFPAMERAA